MDRKGLIIGSLGLLSAAYIYSSLSWARYVTKEKRLKAEDEKEYCILCNSYDTEMQGEKHFEEYSDEIIEKYSPSPSFISTVEEVFPMITNRDKIITVVNVRRGDYLMFPDYHPTVSEEYIHSAIKLIPDTDQYLVASDDLDWCKAKLKFDKPVTYLQGWKSHEQLWIMSMCHHFIISNSSFSWWAAYLSTYENKIVVAPKTWFGPKFSGGWEDMYCKDWIIHPTYFDNGKIYPGKRKRV